MSKKHHHTRRAFLGNTAYGCASIGVTTLLSGWTNMGLINAAAAANRPTYANSDYRALVCILLAGGNDSYNMLMPKGNDEYAEYASVRTNLAIPQSSLLSLNPLNPDGKEYGLHPNLSNVQNLFNTEELAFIANIGTLAEPTSLSTYNLANNLPLGLYSHRDQAQQWQTSLPQDRNANGWGGRLADILQTNNQNQDISMNISLDGLNVFQRGQNVSTYSINTTGNGSVLINNAEDTGFYENLKRQTVDNLLEYNYQNILEKAYANSIIGSKNNSIEFDTAIANGEPFGATFGTGALSQRLNMVARTIAARDLLGVTNQTFFVQLGGFDNHDDNLIRHGLLMTELDAALNSFNQAMKDLQLHDQVTTFTISDFARKLISNGDGSDHAWGGHTLVMGGAVQGKHIYGQFPELYFGNGLDTGEGRIIPTTSCDEYFAELALWFGASAGDLNQILPNINNFWTPTTQGHPIGFLNY
jgi:uncharacterized protein (DUF1501 family)